MASFCMPHWNMLRRAVRDRGMDHLVAPSGEEAARAAAAQLEGTDTVEDWDPLMAAHWAIMSKVLQAVGLAGLAEVFCPLCAVQESFDAVSETDDFKPERHHNAQQWVDSCTDAMLDYAREQKLMPGVQ